MEYIFNTDRKTICISKCVIFVNNENAEHITSIELNVIDLLCGPEKFEIKITDDYVLSFNSKSYCVTDVYFELDNITLSNAENKYKLKVYFDNNVSSESVDSEPNLEDKINSFKKVVVKSEFSSLDFFSSILHVYLCNKKNKKISNTYDYKISGLLSNNTKGEIKIKEPFIEKNGTEIDFHFIIRIINPMTFCHLKTGVHDGTKVTGAYDKFPFYVEQDKPTEIFIPDQFVYLFIFSLNQYH